MIVRRPRLISECKQARVEAVVESETGKFEPFRWFISVPHGLSDWLDTSGNAFVPSLLLLASALKERLVVEASVSRVLAQNATRANLLYSDWWATAPVRLQADSMTATSESPRGAALLFTRGVDSWFSAMRAAAATDAERVTHLLYSPDLDRHYSPGTRSRALELTREAAETVGCPLVPVYTNARELLDRFLSWEWTHGGVLAGIGLALGRCLRSFVVSSTFDVDHLIPWGSHPDLDLLWSTEQTTIRHDGADTTRTDKIRALAGFPEALARIKVCWCADIERNCGKCEKCLRTQCALAIAGVLDQCPVFENRLTPEAIHALPQLPRPFWVELQQSLRSKSELAEISQVVEAKLSGDGLHNPCHGHMTIIKGVSTKAGRPRRPFVEAARRVWRAVGRQIVLPLDATRMSDDRVGSRLRILLVSSGGVRNHGDDAILLATLQRLQRIRPGCRVTVVSDGNSVPPLIGSCVWVGTTETLCRQLQPAAIRRGCRFDRTLAEQLIGRVAASTSSALPAPDLSNFDVVLFAGGGNLTSHFPTIVAWRTAIAAACRGLKVPFVLSGQGVGPITEEIKPMLRFLASNAHRFGTRDPLSAALVASLGRHTRSVDCVGDDAIGLTPAPDAVVDHYLEASGVPPNKPLMAFHAREAPDYGGFDRRALIELAQGVDRLAAANGFAVVGVPINSQPWAPECGLLEHLAHATRRAPWFVVDCGENVPAIAGVIGRSRAAITLSYHVALFALERDIPTRIAVRTEYYRRKAEGLRQFFGLMHELALPARPGDLRLSDITHRRDPHIPCSSSSIAIDSWLDQALPPSASIIERAAA